MVDEGCCWARYCGQVLWMVWLRNWGSGQTLMVGVELFVIVEVVC